MIVGLDRFTELDVVDANIRGNLPERQLAQRCARFASRADAFRRWLRDQRVRVSRISRPGYKLTYIARHWDGLKTLLDYGRVELASGCVERRSRYRTPSARPPREGRSFPRDCIIPVATARVPFPGTRTVTAAFANRRQRPLPPSQNS